MTILNVENITFLRKLAAVDENNAVVAVFEKMPKRKVVVNGENVNYSGSYCTYFVEGHGTGEEFGPSAPFEESDEEFVVGREEVPSVPNFVFTDNDTEDDVDDVVQFRYYEDGGKHYIETKLNPRFTYIDYSATANEPSLEWTYDAQKNAFIPPCPEENYVLNETTFKWHPDPTKDFDLHGDGKQYRYNPENDTWSPNW